MCMVSELSRPDDVSCLLDDETRPDPADSAWLLGYELARIGEVSEPPGGFTQAEADAFREGWRHGERLRQPWDDAAGEPEPDWEAMFPGWNGHDPCEVIEAVGAVEARRGGGL